MWYRLHNCIPTSLLACGTLSSSLSVSDIYSMEKLVCFMFTIGQMSRVLSSNQARERYVRALQFLVPFSGSAWSKFQMAYFIEKGLSASVAGGLSSASLIVKLLSYPVWGILCDLTNQPQLVLTVAIVLGNVSLLFMQLAMPVLLRRPMLLLTVKLIRSVLNASWSLVDSFTLQLTQHQISRFGSHRLFGSIAFGLGSLAAGLAIDWAQSVDAVFYYTYITSLPLLILVCVFRFEDAEQQSGKMGKDLEQGADIGQGVVVPGNAQLAGTVLAQPAPAPPAAGSATVDHISPLPPPPPNTTSGGISDQDIIAIAGMAASSSQLSQPAALSVITTPAVPPLSPPASPHQLHTRGNKLQEQSSRSGVEGGGQAARQQHTSTKHDSRHGSHGHTLSQLTRQRSEQLRWQFRQFSRLLLHGQVAHCLLIFSLYFVLFAVVDDFLYMQLAQEFRTHGTFVGVCVWVSTLAAVAVFAAGHRLLESCGWNRLVIMAQGSLLLRLIGHTFITQDKSRLMLMIPLQLLHGFNYASFWVVARLYMHAAASHYSHTAPYLPPAPQSINTLAKNCTSAPNLTSLVKRNKPLHERYSPASRTHDEGGTGQAGQQREGGQGGIHALTHGVLGCVWTASKGVGIGCSAYLFEHRFNGRGAPVFFSAAIAASVLLCWTMNLCRTGPTAGPNGEIQKPGRPVLFEEFQKQAGTTDNASN
eukprot:g45764.t1